MTMRKPVGERRDPLPTPAELKAYGAFLADWQGPQDGAAGHSARYVTELGGYHRGAGDRPPLNMEGPGSGIATWQDMQKWLRRRYDKARADRPSGRALRDRPRTGGHFVAVDSEGFNLSAYTKGKGREESTYYDHRTFLWMAGGAEGFENQAYDDPHGCQSADIFEFLLSLPRKFASGPGGKQPVFISFGFGYDVGQIVKDFPYEKGWQVHNAKPWDKRPDPKYRSNRNAPILWKNYAIRYVSSKSVTLYRLRDPDRPFKKGHKLDHKEKIEIFDCYGFFQSSLVAAIENTPGVATPEELAIIKNGKGGRGNFKVEDIERHKIYTAMELKALVKLMDIQREGLRTAIKDKPIELARWHGAGAIAKATLDLYIGGGKRDKETRARVRKMLGGLETDTPEKKERMDWVMRAYFGGRTDLVKQGNHHGVIHEYDIASAYPAIAVDLPNMAGGSWEKVANPTRKQVESSGIPSFRERPDFEAFWPS